MEQVLGLLKIRVKRGINLAVRDFRSSDPYVVLQMGNQKLKTQVVKRNVNPEWNIDLTFAVADSSLPIKLFVYDKDTFSADDMMGDAEFGIGELVEAVRVRPQGVPSGTIISRLQPSRQNCLAQESCIMYTDDGQLVQNMCIRLKNEECGEVELQLKWKSS